MTHLNVLCACQAHLHIVMHFAVQKRRGVYQAEPPPFAVELKFVLIPVSFIFIRMWGTIRFFIGFQLLAASNDASLKHQVYKQINHPFLVNMHVSCAALLQGEQWSHYLSYFSTMCVYSGTSL